MVTVVYGYGALRRRPPRLLLRSLLQLVRTRWQHLGPRGAANMLVALARLKLPPHAGWVRGLLRQTLLVGAKRAMAKVGEPAEAEHSSSAGGLTFEGAARILWALGTLCIHPGPDVMEVLVREVQAASLGIEQPEVRQQLDGAAEDDLEQAARVWRMRLLEQARWGCQTLGHRVG